MLTFVRGHNGATENAGHENVAQSKMQGFKMRDMKMQKKTAGVENEGHGLKITGDCLAPRIYKYILTCLLAYSTRIYFLLFMAKS